MSGPAQAPSQHALPRQYHTIDSHNIQQILLSCELNGINIVFHLQLIIRTYNVHKRALFYK